MKDISFLYESIVKSTEFYQRLMDNNSIIEMFIYKKHVLMYEYNQNKSLKYTYFIHFKHLPLYKYVLTILRDGKFYTNEIHYTNYQADKVKKKSFTQKR